VILTGFFFCNYQFLLKTNISLILFLDCIIKFLETAFTLYYFSCFYKHEQKESVHIKLYFRLTWLLFFRKFKPKQIQHQGSKTTIKSNSMLKHEHNTSYLHYCQRYDTNVDGGGEVIYYIPCFILITWDTAM